MIDSGNTVVLLFEDVEDAADALLALHALRDGTYDHAVITEQFNTHIPELDKAEIVDLQTVRDRETPIKGAEW